MFLTDVIALRVGRNHDPVAALQLGGVTSLG